VEQLQLLAVPDEQRLAVLALALDPKRRERLVALMAQAIVTVHAASADGGSDDRPSR
jgi:hypothetical protein